MCFFNFIVEQQWFEEIQHCFLLLGHIFLPCYADLGVTDKVEKENSLCFHTTRLDKLHKMLP
jgi:hypothetical protein